MVASDMAHLPTYTTQRQLVAGAKRAAVLGSPIDHSLSPLLHLAAYEALGLTGWCYDRGEVKEHELSALLGELDEEWAGLSLTMPLKQAALTHLDVIDPLAEVVGGANTVIVQPGASHPLLVGANTDVAGIVAALQEAGGPSFAPRRAVVLGAGATAAATLAALAQLGITTSTVLARRPGRAAGLHVAAHRMGVHIEVLPWRDHDTALDAIAHCDVAISTLPPRAADGLAANLNQPAATGTTSGGVLLDVAYDPWPSALASAWQAAGGLVAAGRVMLLHQAAEQVRLMTGQEAPLPQMRRALEAALATSG